MRAVQEMKSRGQSEAEMNAELVDMLRAKEDSVFAKFLAILWEAQDDLAEVGYPETRQELTIIAILRSSTSPEPGDSAESAKSERGGASGERPGRRRGCHCRLPRKASQEPVRKRSMWRLATGD